MPFLPFTSSTGNLSAVDPTASSCLLDFTDGLSYAEVVANRIDTRYFWRSTECPDMVVSSNTSSMAVAGVGKIVSSLCINALSVASPPLLSVASPPLLSVASPPHLSVASPPLLSVASPPLPSVASPPRSMCAVIPGVERDRLSVSEKAAMQKFVKKLSSTIKGSKVGMGKRRRYEWLFASRSYSYGRNGSRLIEPYGAFSEVEHLCPGIVNYLKLVSPNACLLVYYPKGSSGLNMHKDDEPIHACDQVITLCDGAGSTLVLADNNKQEVAREWLKGGDFYVFRNQVSFFHGVDGVESVGNGRWAFTFRVFKQTSAVLPVASVPVSSSGAPLVRSVASVPVSSSGASLVRSVASVPVSSSGAPLVCSVASVPVSSSGAPLVRSVASVPVSSTLIKFYKVKIVICQLIQFLHLLFVNLK